MRSRNTLIVAVLLLILGVGHAFGATLVPYPLNVPKGAYVNGGGVDADDNFYWQTLTLTPAAAHTYGTSFEVTLPTGMSIADVNNDGLYHGELSTLWTDAGATVLNNVFVQGVNSTNNTIRYGLDINRVSNGLFADTDGWTLVGAATAISGGALTIDASGTASQDTYEVVGSDVVVVYEITNVGAGPGAVRASIGGKNGANNNAVGVYMDKLTDLTSTADLTFTETSGTNAVIIDNVYVFAQTQSNGSFTTDSSGWTLGTGWTHDAGNGEVDHSTVGAPVEPLVQNGNIVPGVTYKVAATVTNYVAGTFTMTVGGTSSAIAIGANLTYYAYLTATDSSPLTITPTGAFDGSITDIIVEPVGVKDGAFDTAAQVDAGPHWAFGAANVSIAGGVLAFTDVDTATQNIGSANGDIYTLIFTVSNFGAGITGVTPSIGGTNGTSRAANGTYVETITSGAGTDLVFTSAGAAGTCDIDDVIVIKHSQIDVGDVVNMMFPVETAEDPGVSTDDVYVDFIDGTTDDISNGSGTAITYVDPGPKTINLVSFAANLSANNDTTNTLGDRYPTSGAATFGALPDLVPDAGDNYQQGQNLGITLDATEDGTEAMFAVWISTDSTLAHIDSLAAGVFHTQKYPDLTTYLVDEGDTGGTRYATSGLPEGTYYYYITSYLTGDFVLARSDGLVVRHWPVVDTFGWDRDHDGTYTTGAPAAGDDGNTTLDSGSYYDYSDTRAASGHYTYIDLYSKVEDLDDNAKIHLFYSTETNLAADLSKITTSGAAVDSTLAITGLTGASLIKADLLENSKDAQGYVKWRWETHPDSVGSVITAANYTLYCVTCDGKNLDISELKGAGGTSLVSAIKHSPYLSIDALTEYDNVAGGDININVQDHDAIMLSWGKSGIFGDNDYDDAATIEFYIDLDTGGDNNADYAHTDAATLRNDAATSNDTHEIVTGLAEDNEARDQSWYMWDLQADFASTGWFPTDGSTYHLYAIIDESKTGGTARVVTLGSTLPTTAPVLAMGDNELVFTNTPFTRLSDPPKEGVTVNAEQTYRMDFAAFDWDNNASVGIWIVDETNFPTGPHSLYVSNLDSTGIKAYCLTDDDGDHTGGTNAFLAENTADYFDLTIRTAGSATATYTATAAGAATTLDDDTYWVYVGSEKEDITDKVTNGTFTGDATGWNVAANWAYNANNITSGAAAAGNLDQDVSALAGVTYVVEFTVISCVTGGDITPSIGGVAGSAVTIPTVGLPLTYRQRITATGTGNLILAKDGVLATCVIDDIKAIPDPTLHRAPGPLTVVNSGVAAPQRNMTVSPMEVTVAQGDTVQYTLKVADGGGTIDRVDAYVAVEKDYWTIVNTDDPFTEGIAYTGMMLTNEVIDDAVNNRWILRTVVSNGGTSFSVSDTGQGDNLATFELVSKGTSVAIDNTSSVYFINEPANSRVTKFSNDGVDVSVNMLAATVKVIPRAIIEGIVQLEGRNSNATQMTFELRERGSYEHVADSILNTTNDADGNTDGMQLTPDSDGKFTLMKVPTGEYDFVVKYDRYLAKLVEVEVYPGIDTLFVSFGTLLGGDCWGYTDSTGATLPDNAIETGDVNRIQTAFLSTPDSAKWNDGASNYKYADINEDNIVEVDDLSMATANVGQSGAQPVFKPAEMPVAFNSDADFQFMNIPTELVAGQQYTIQVVGFNLQQVRAYRLSMQYDSSSLDFAGITKGDFIQTDSHSFPTVGDANVGLTNAAYGDAIFSGDGVFADVTFIARTDGPFKADMLAFDSISVVNSNFTRETILGNQVTGIDAALLPVEFSLSQNSPNPFNPTTTIAFSIPKDGHVSMNVYDILGRHVRTLIDQSYAPGSHSIVWDARDDSGQQVSAGIYFYVLKSGSLKNTKKMMLIK